MSIIHTTKKLNAFIERMNKGGLLIRYTRLRKFNKRGKNFSLVIKLAGIWYLVILTGSYLTSYTGANLNDIESHNTTIATCIDFDGTDENCISLPIEDDEAEQIANELETEEGKLEDEGEEGNETEVRIVEELQETGGEVEGTPENEEIGANENPVNDDKKDEENLSKQNEDVKEVPQMELKEEKVKNTDNSKISPPSKVDSRLEKTAGTLISENEVSSKDSSNQLGRSYEGEKNTQNNE